MLFLSSLLKVSDTRQDPVEERPTVLPDDWHGIFRSDR
jgi:hypothetical protein